MDYNVEKLETPCFILDIDCLEKNFNNYKTDFETFWPNFITGYSYKTNSLPWLCNWFKKNGCYAEIVSDDEYELAKWIGYSEDKIIFNGPIKGKKNMSSLLQSNGILNVDCEDELDEIDKKDKDTNTKSNLQYN